MRLVGLTGGIGSGKTTVGRLLAALGAEVIDADLIAREVVEPGEPALAEIVERFGSGVLNPDGTLDRAGLASIVFGDPGARRDLEAITHPRIGDRMNARMEAVLQAERADGHERVVVIEHPLLVETGHASAYQALVVVFAGTDVRLERLTAGRDIDPHDARARMAAQASDDERRAAATHVITNDGDLAELEQAVDQLWAQLAP